MDFPHQPPQWRNIQHRRQNPGNPSCTIGRGPRMDGPGLRKTPRFWGEPPHIFLKKTINLLVTIPHFLWKLRFTMFFPHPRKIPWSCCQRKGYICEQFQLVCWSAGAFHLCQSVCPMWDENPHRLATPQGHLDKRSRDLSVWGHVHELFT